MLSPTAFRFIGQEADFGANIDWNSPNHSKLWLYNLHYFDDLRAEAAEQRTSWHRGLIEKWRQENPPAIGNGWEPYPLSLRIVNWIAWILAGNDPSDEILQSLAVQIRTLRTTLEFHLLGNHLLANAKALVFAGCFFTGKEAKDWLETGLALLNSELQEQILDDGGHFELSPMYHAIILEDVLDLLQLSSIFPNELGTSEKRWRALAEQMLAWLAVMNHPDGEIAFFNDAAFAIAKPRAHLQTYATRLNVPFSPKKDKPLQQLKASGYIRMESGPLCAIFDVAEIGPSYLPGHGHADVLSLEVSLDGHRLLTNGGTSTYAPGKLRDEERETASHVTIEIDGHSSSEVWGSFRVGRRAHPSGISCGSSPNQLWAEASHDGYGWLPGKPSHQRHVSMEPTVLSIKDTIAGNGIHSVIGRFPLHPQVTSVTPDTAGWRLEFVGGRMIRVHVIGPCHCFLMDGYYAPTFGQRLQRPILAWRSEGPLPLVIETRFEL